MKKDRGIFLTITLIFPLLALLFSIPRLFNPFNPWQNIDFIGNWYFPFAYLKLSFALVSIWGIWMWKKWAVYLFFINLIVGIVIFFISRWNNLPTLYPISTMSIAIAILANVLLLWAVYHKWKHFE